MGAADDGGWRLPVVVSDAIAAVPDSWRQKLIRHMGYFIGSKMPAVAEKVADHVDTVSGRSLIRHELAKAAAAKAIKNEEMVDRTLYRLCGDLLDRQDNIEKIAILSAEEIVDFDTPPSEEDINKDWRTKFTGFAEEVSEPEMQRVWAKILANEFHKPGSFSLRTLRIVSEMGADVAKTFAKVSEHRFAGHAIFVEGEKWSRGDDVASLMVLQDWGLIHEKAGLITKKYQWRDGRYTILGETCGAVIFSMAGPLSISVPIITYTESGRQLLRLMPSNNELEVLERIARSVRGEIEDSKLAVVGPLSFGDRSAVISGPFRYAWGDPSMLDEVQRS